MGSDTLAIEAYGEDSTLDGRGLQTSAYWTMVRSQGDQQHASGTEYQGVQ